MQRTLTVRVLLALALLTAGAVPARADLIVINANHFQPGTDLSNLFSGLSMSKLRNEFNINDPIGAHLYRPIASPVYAVSTHQAPGLLSVGGTGYELLDYNRCYDGGGSPSGCLDYNVLELRFDSPTVFLQFDSRSFSDDPGVLAFDTLGNLIDLRTNGLRTFTWTRLDAPDSPVDSILTVSRDQADIARVVYAGWGGHATPLRISYSVPEPTTFGLMALGLLGLFRRRNRPHFSK